MLVMLVSTAYTGVASCAPLPIPNGDEPNVRPHSHPRATSRRGHRHVTLLRSHRLAAAVRCPCVDPAAVARSTASRHPDPSHTTTHTTTPTTIQALLPPPPPDCSPPYGELRPYGPPHRQASAQHSENHHRIGHHHQSATHHKEPPRRGKGLDICPTGRGRRGSHDALLPMGERSRPIPRHRGRNTAGIRADHHNDGQGSGDMWATRAR